MLKGFKEFIMRGNVIDLAVAFVVGVAFTAVVNALVEQLINPLIGALFSADNLKNTLIVEIPTLSGGTAELSFGAVIAAVIQFLLVAAAVYFALVMPMNYLKRRAEAKRAAGASEEEVPPTELDLLAEIRDLLAKTESGPSERGSHVAQ
ncbi:MAG TPA: large conductance mechanosensitive channel protein MscL [Homoserinimonas sp.]|nr:large conductance mechanosensitive channel protein MscL [Homoserinimonas sp.]